MIFDRTFHPDEANQAFTVGKLLETGQYVYRPEDHHGPTLYYAAAALQKAYGHDSTATLDGTLLRCTPLLFAILTLVFGFLALRKLIAFSALGSKTPKALKTLAAPCFVVLLGTSPIFVFFATDFIQEMLLACFTLMMFWAGVGYVCPGGKWKPGTWALLFGIAAGLAFATKETSVLTFAAAGLSSLTLKVLNSTKAPGDPNALKVPNSRGIALAAMGFLLTSILFCSSFCSNWQGVYNAFVAAPLSYLHRAAGSAASAGAAWHVHPWWKYLYWLFADDRESLPFFVLCGILFAILFRFIGLKLRPEPLTLTHALMHAPRTRAFLFMTLYALFLFAFYSLIPYKTPWCALQLHTPLSLAAMLGFTVSSDIYASANLSFVPPAWWPLSWKAQGIWWQGHPRLIKAISILPLTVAATILFATNCHQCIYMNKNPDSREIRFNYAAASPEVKELAATVATAMKATAQGGSIPRSDNNSRSGGLQSASPFIAVALPPEDTWPFPWYNRALESQTGYWTDFEALRILAKSDAKPSVVIVPMEQGHLVQPLFPYLKKTKRFYMRPGVRVRVFWMEGSN